MITPLPQSANAMLGFKLSGKLHDEDSLKARILRCTGHRARLEMPGGMNRPRDLYLSVKK